MTAVTGLRWQSQQAPVRPRHVLLLLILIGVSAGVPGGQQTAATAEAFANAGWTAIEAKRYGAALDAFERASRLEPDDASHLFGAGVSTAILGKFGDARTWLERALKLNPRYTAASLLLGDVLSREGHLREAIAVYSAALKHAPDNRRLQESLERWQQESRLDSTFYQAQSAHFSVLFEGPADDVLARRVTEMLERAYYRIGNTLYVYPSRTVTVVLYTQEQFRDVTRSPEWARGLYDGRIKIPIRGALERSDELQRVLDHELVHATVATLAGHGVPPWLNEGLAMALESGGVDWAHQQLEIGTTRIPYARLTTEFGRLPSTDAFLAYAQSTVAVKRLLDLRGPQAIVALLQKMGEGASFEAAFQQSIHIRLEDFAAMLEHE